MSALPSPESPVAAAAAPEPCLLFEGDQGPVRHAIPEGITRIGRSSRNTLPLKDATVSRFHCFLSRSGREVRLYDAGSDNGTRIGSEKAEDGRLLASGDVLVLGNFKIEFRDAGQPWASSEPPAGSQPETPGKPAAEPQEKPREEAARDVVPEKVVEGKLEAAEIPESRLAKAPEIPHVRPRSFLPLGFASLALALAGLAIAAFVLLGNEPGKEPDSSGKSAGEPAGAHDARPAPLFGDRPQSEEGLAREVKALSEAVAALEEKVRTVAARRPDPEDPQSSPDGETPAAGLEEIEKELASLREENERISSQVQGALARNDELARELTAKLKELETIADRAAAGADGEGKPAGDGDAKEGPTPSRTREDPEFDPEGLAQIERSASWLLATQADDGSWALQPDGPADVATTSLAALALQGVSPVIPTSSQRAEVEAAIRCAVNFVATALESALSSTSDGYIARELGHGVEAYLAGLLFARAYEGATPNVRKKLRTVLAALAPWIDRLLGSGEGTAPDIRLLGFRALQEIERCGIALSLSYDLADALGRLEGSFLDDARPPVLVAGRRYAGEHFLKAYVVADAMASADRTRWEDRLWAARKVLVGLANSDGSYTGHEGVTSRSFCTAAALLALGATGKR